MEPSTVNAADPALNVMDALRESTKDMHNDTEGHEFQRSLGGGTLDKARYVTYLEQLYLMHKHLATLLGQCAASNKAVAAVVQDYHHDHSAVLRDLKYFGEDGGQARPLAATTRICARMDQYAASNPLGLLGHLYVLEGSTNGAKFMAKNIIAGMGLPQDQGATYFDRYGDKQRERWTAFKERMNGNNFNQAQIDEIVAAGKEMFIAFFEIGDELSKPGH
ncbi:MAG: biliverdin-producing heme oxygenase [Cyanobacteria bacterium SZAS LIN-2]|nr:biliverdin-producing heme oxygenase [Cyanobacteria bacterium SZAS LIN-2]MBS2006480.1 biliverdin-producing heme oxygenase [Cyanobacteria bacterium SZAS TMP-1]